MAYVSSTDPYIKAIQSRPATNQGNAQNSSASTSGGAYVSTTDPYIKAIRKESEYTPRNFDPLMDAASGVKTTKPAVKPQATPNLNINAFGAGNTSGGAKLMGNIFGAAGTGIAASAVETAGQLTQPQGLTIGENARLAAQGKGTQEEIAKAEKEKADRIRENIQKPLYETSDKLQEKSQQLTENAKEGLDSVGQFLVDASITGAQLAGDVALGAINPVLGTGAMATRVFGSSAQEARQAGATESQQQIYGLASAATSILVEKVAQVGNLFKRAYGGSIAGGSVDDILNKVIGKAVKNPTAQRAIASALGEGGEEALEAIIQPALQAIYDKGENLNKTWFTDNSEEAKEYLAEVGYNALLGSVLGAIGGGNVSAPVETTTEAQNTTPNTTAPRVDVEGDTNTPTAQNGAEGVTEAIAANEPTISVEEIANANKNLSVSDIEAVLPRAKQIYVASTEAQNRLNAVLDDVARTLGFSREHDTQKSIGSIVSRIVRDNAYGKTGSPIKDAARGHLEMPSWDYTQRVLDALTNAKIPYTATQKQTAQGYRGLHLTWDDGGVGVELQLTTPEVWAVKMKSEEIYAKWREFEANGADPNSVPAEVYEEYEQDIARSLEMWSQLAPVLPDFTMFATSSSDSGVPSISSVKETGDVGLTQEPLTSSSTRTEVSPVSFNTRPDSVKMNTKSSPSADIVADGENYVNKATEAQNSVGAAHPSQLPFSHAETLYGILPESDRAVRPDDVPRSVDGKTHVSQSVVSAKGSPLTSDGFVPILERGTLEGDYSFARLTNNKAVQNAMKLIKRAGSREGAYSDWLSTVNRKGMNAERAAEAMLLYNDAQYHGEFAKARKIFTEYQRLERDNARALQIARLWHEMTPQNQLDILFEQVNNLNEELAAANKQKIGADVPVEEWLTRIGEELAVHLEEAGNLPNAKVNTVAQTIIKDLKHFYNKDSYDKVSADQAAKADGKRTEYDRLRDMLNNFGEYLTAFEATKAKLAEDLKDYPEAVAAFTEWIYDLPNIGKRLARELMGETDIQISDDATAAFLNAKTAAEKDAALDAIAAEVAAQIPTSIKDILTTLRYTNMLFNLKTTNRNLIGNIAMMASSRLKNAISAGMQRVIPSLENTRSVKVKPEYKDIGRAEFEKHKRTIMSQGKYSDATIGSADDFGSRVEELRNKANNTGNKKIDKLLTPLRVSNDATQKLLNNAKFGDEAFLRNHYAFALGGYLQAQGITPEQWNDPQWQADNEELVNKILGFAATEAQENTFRDRNEFSDWVASIGRGNSAMPKIFKPISEGLFPFRRTTANVAKAGFDYSPAGLIGTAVNVGRKSLGDAEFLNPALVQIQEAFGKKDVTANDIADQLAKGLTGTGLMLVGYILSKLGLLRGGEDDDKAQAEFDKQVGRQPYSFEIGDHSITLDWLSPTSMPLFMGAALQQLVADEGLSSKTVGEALLTLTDPMIEMSMLSGLKDSLDGIKYADNNILQFALDASLNWLFQYMYSTAGGQIERTFEENRMMTYVDKNKNAPSWWQYARGRNAAKGLGEYGQTEYIDAWGNTQSNGSFLGRALENFISPAYHNKVELNSVEKELQRVYDATGENVLPSLADKKIGDKNLTAEEYTEYAKTRGNEMFNLMQKVVDSSAYKKSNDAQKAKMLLWAKDYANDVAKNKVADKALEGWVAKSKQYKIDPAVYIEVKSLLEKANAGSSISQDELETALEKTSLSRSDKNKIWNAYGSKWKYQPYK